MAEIFKSGVAKTKEKVERKSLLELRKVIQVLGARHLFTSFATFPPSVCFETQDDGEGVVVFLRQHPIVNLGWIVGALLMLTLSSVFGFFPPYANLPAGYQFVVTSGWYLFVTGFVLAKFMGWFFNIYLITDERVVDVDFYGLLYRDLTVAKLDKIQDINFTQAGSFAAIFNYGNIYIQTAAERTRFEFMKVPNPAKVVEILYQLLEEEEKEVIEGRVK